MEEEDLSTGVSIVVRGSKGAMDRMFDGVGPKYYLGRKKDLFKKVLLETTFPKVNGKGSLSVYLSFDDREQGSMYLQRIEGIMSLLNSIKMRHSSKTISLYFQEINRRAIPLMDQFVKDYSEEYVPFHIRGILNYFNSHLKRKGYKWPRRKLILFEL